MRLVTIVKMILAVIIVLEVIIILIFIIIVPVLGGRGGVVRCDGVEGRLV